MSEAKRRNASSTDTAAQSKYADVTTNRLSPGPFDFTTVDVYFSLASTVMKSYLDAQFAQYDQAVCQSGGRLTFTKEEFIQYCGTTVQSRIDWTNNNRPVIHPMAGYRVPAYLSLVISNIGKVEIAEKGLVLKPCFDGSNCWEELNEEGEKVIFEDEFVPMTAQECEQMSLKLRGIERNGFTFAEGFAKDKEGAEAMMTMQVVENQVLALNQDAHPFYSVIAATFAVQGMANQLGSQAFRTKYGDLEQIANLVTGFACPAGGA